MIKKILKKFLPKFVFEETRKLVSRADFDEGPIPFMEIYEVIPPLTERIKHFFDNWSPVYYLVLWGLFMSLSIIVVGIIGTVGIL